MRAVRFIAPILLTIQLAFHKNYSGFWVDLVGFNFIAIITSVSVLIAPRIKNKWAQPLTALAIGVWSLGSIAATMSTYFGDYAFIGNLSEPLYLLFYPLALLGVQLLISIQQR